MDQTSAGLEAGPPPNEPGAGWACTARSTDSEGGFDAVIHPARAGNWFKDAHHRVPSPTLKGLEDRASAIGTAQIPHQLIYRGVAWPLHLE